jgi:hypothetical protein
MMQPPRILARPRKGVSILRECRASAAAEMALDLPAIAFIVLNITDLVIYAYSRMQVDLAAQEAVGAARAFCNTSSSDRELPAQLYCSGVDQTITDAAKNTSLGSAVTLTTTSGIIHSNEAWYCANTSGQLAPAPTPSQPAGGYSINSAPPNDCSGVVSGSTIAPGDYISVTANYTYTPVFPGFSVASLLSGTITRTAWMRLK